MHQVRIELEHGVVDEDPAELDRSNAPWWRRPSAGRCNARPPATSTCRTARVEVREARASEWPAVSALLAELGRPDVRGDDDEAAPRPVRGLPCAPGHRRAGRGGRRRRRGFHRPRVPPAAELPGAAGVGSGPGRRGSVTEPRRGTALLAEAMERSRERGCWSLELESASGEIEHTRSTNARK